MSKKPLVLQVVEDYRAAILARDAATLADLTRRWYEVERYLQAQMLDLALEIGAMQDAGQTVSRAKLMRLERYQELLTQAQQQTAQYNRWAADTITSEQRQAAELGIRGAAEAIEAVYREAGVYGVFGRMNVGAVESLMGFASDGSPLADLLAAKYPEIATKITDSLVSGLASGFNPRKVAAQMAADLSMNLDSALTISRTEMLRAFRYSSQEQYIQSGVVNGYIRRAALSDRTCAACLALDGKRYETDELYASHPNCRCTLLPLLTEFDTPKMQSGSEWFEKQKPEVQEKILGASKFKAWREGRFAFDDVARIKDDKTWGPTIRMASLGELVK